MSAQHQVVAAAESALQSNSDLITEALCSNSGVTEGQLQQAIDLFKSLKHQFVDQRSKLLLATSLGSEEPFAALSGAAIEIEGEVPCVFQLWRCFACD